MQTIKLGVHSGMTPPETRPASSRTETPLRCRIGQTILHKSVDEFSAARRHICGLRLSDRFAQRRNARLATIASALDNCHFPAALPERREL
jgi:hypothetical protein